MKGAGGSAFTAGLALATGLSLTFLLLPLVALLVEAPLSEMPGLLGEEVVQDALVVTARTNGIANLLIVGFGLPAAWLLATRTFRGRALVITLVELPLVLPPAVAGVGLLAAFSAGGLLGDTRAPFTEIAVILAVTFVASPFFMRQAISTFEALDPQVLDAARTLGASPARAFWTVALPLSAGGLVAGWVLAFARGIGEFGATIIFAGNVAGETQTLTLAVYEQLEADFDIALLLGVLLVALSALTLLTYKLVLAWRASISTSSSTSATSLSASR